MMNNKTFGGCKTDVKGLSCSLHAYRHDNILSEETVCDSYPLRVVGDRQWPT